MYDVLDEFLMESINLEQDEAPKSKFRCTTLHYFHKICLPYVKCPVFSNQAGKL